VATSSSPCRMSDPLTPETLRLLYRLTIGLALLAGVLFLVAFALGVMREGVARWFALVLGVLFLSTPLLLARLRSRA
jgi:hypothetical protein